MAGPSFAEALRFWLKLGFVSFGGPTGQIAIMHAELVERRGWISDSRFLHALNYCMLLPGPEAQQLATYIGWLLHRTRGGIAAGALFVLPSVFILFALSWVYVTYGTIPLIAAAFYGLKPAVTGIVAAAAISIGRRVLKNAVMWIVAALAFVSLSVLRLPFPLLIGLAGVIGLVGARLWPANFVVIGQHAPSAGGAAPSVTGDGTDSPAHARPSLGRSIKVLAIGVLLWWTPVLFTSARLGSDHSVAREGFFFSKAALVTVGGAYAVLPYVSQQAVESEQWLSPSEMIDGLGLAETTPGPLIMVVQFVGFMGGWNDPGNLSPLAAATWGALLTTWVTFLPSFIFIFLGAPYVERLRGNVAVTSVLSAVTAAVVGVVLSLAVWFGLHVIVKEGGAVDWFAVLLAVIVFAVIVRWRVSVVWVALGAAIVGVGYWSATGVS